jgi:hypothetical protein
VKKKTIKRTYRLRNWKQYNAALVQPEGLTLRVSDEILTLWINQEKTGERGRSQIYSDITISRMATLKKVYHLSLRPTESFLLSLIKLPAVKGGIPDHTILSRRCTKLAVSFCRIYPKAKPCIW